MVDGHGTPLLFPDPGGMHRAIYVPGLGGTRPGSTVRAVAARSARMVFCAAPTGPCGGLDRAEIAQLVEHATENRGVASSNLALGTITRVGTERKWLSW